MAVDRIMNCNEVEITDEGVTIIAYTGANEKIIVPCTKLQWRNPYEDGDDYDLPLFLTLKEISDQLASKGYKPTFYVWYETGLSGKIYLYGNGFSYWREHGETNGYA